MRQVAWFLSLALLLASCKTRVPKGVIPEKEMEEVLYDYHRATALADHEGTDVTRRRYLLVQKVFEKHGITEPRFDSSMVYYSGQARMLKDMYDRLESRIKSELSDVGATASTDVYANISAEGDTAMIWQQQNLWLKNNAEENLVSIKLQPDSTFLLGDTYMLRFDTHFVGNNAKREAFAILTARFDNDSVASVTSRVGGNYESTLNLPESDFTKNHRLEQLSATFYLTYDDVSHPQLWMISKPIIVRFHKLQKDEESVAKQDSLAQEMELMSVSSDTIEAKVDTVRMSLEEIRDSHQGERKINVVRKKKVVLPKQPVRRRLK